MEKNFHPFHMVMVSPWPLLIGMSVMTMMIGLINMFDSMNLGLMVYGMLLSLIISLVWWRDVIRESTYCGDHSSEVMTGMMLGMLLFILSEVFFFLSFFWSFFHSSLSPDIEVGTSWPPMGIQTLNAFQVPLLNTVILLSSGVSVTLCHQSMLNSNWNMSWNYLLITWLLGLYFLILQLLEYIETMFMMSDSVFGSVFFMSTGFHGFHVILGTLFLMFMWFRMKSNHFSNSHHFGFEAAAWYWHFVDVVWLFLFSVVYWWGS